MERATMICVAVLSSVVLFAPAASAKPVKPDKPEGAKNIAAQQCAAAKQADKAAFRALYGPKHAMRTCKKGETKQAQSELKNAAKVCKAEQAADPAGFEATYGGPYSSNAFGKCVSMKAQAKGSADVEEFKNAAKECKAERAADPEGFKAEYGTGKKGRNALGKCVSAKVREAPAPTPTA